MVWKTFAATNTANFSGNLNSKNPVATFNVTATASGSLTASASYSKLRGLKLDILNSSNQVVATSSTGNPVTGFAAVSPGSYIVKLTGTGNGSYKLSISYPTPDPTPPPAPTKTWSQNGLTTTQTTLLDPLHSAYSNGSMEVMGNGRIPTHGNISAMFYAATDEHNYGTLTFWIRFRDESKGTQVDIKLPNQVNFHDSPTWDFDNAGNFWLMGDDCDGVCYNGVTIFHYATSGTPLPSTMTLVSSQTFGAGLSDLITDSIFATKSGGVIATWHVHDQEALYSAYRPAGGQWVQLPAITNLVTPSSRWSTMQHPADDSLWVFGIADAWHQIEAVRYHEANGQLLLDWSDPGFITVPKYTADFGPDGEDPDVKVAANPVKGTIDVAYQSYHWAYFNGQRGCYPVIAHVAASGAPTFNQLAMWVERASPLALTVDSAGNDWLAYHNMAPDGTFFALDASRLSNGTWSGPITLGTDATSQLGQYGNYNWIAFVNDHPAFYMNYNTIQPGALFRYDLTAP